MAYKIYETLHYGDMAFCVAEYTFATESEALNEYIDRVAHNSQIYESYESWEENSVQRGMTHWFYIGAITLQIDLAPIVRKRAIRK